MSDAAVELVFFLTGEYGGAGACVAGGASCRCCPVIAGGVGDNYTVSFVISVYCVVVAAVSRLRTTLPLVAAEAKDFKLPSN